MDLSFLKSPHGQDPVIIEAEFAASVTRLFQAWTTPEDIKQWFGADEGGPAIANVDLQVGGSWGFVFAEKGGQTDGLAGKYIAIEQDRYLQFSWVHTRRFAEGATEVSPESIVSLTFESREKGSFVRLVHKAIGSESSRMNIGGGWGSSIMKMKVLIE